jgi:predicted AAA+ superfamily ATPase
LRPKAKSISLPVLQDDETTKEGIAAVVTKLLVRSGLLVENPEKDMPDAPALITSSDLESRYVIVVCDGLSHERWRSYLKEILNLQAS